MHKNKIVLLGLLILMGGAMAELDSCYTPEYLNTLGWYEYADGLNQSDTYDGVYDVSGQTLNATILERLGATGMSKITAFHWHETTNNNRGLAYLFYDSVHARYYAVFQMSYSDQSINDIQGLRDLQKQVNGNDTRYISPMTPIGSPVPDNSRAVWFEENNLSAAMITRAVTVGSVSEELDLWKYGNDTFSAYFSGVPVTTTTDAAGFIHINHAYVAGGHGIIVGNTTGPQVNGLLLATLTVAPHWYNNASYGCGGNVGNVTFYAYEGSDACGAYGSVPNVDCSIAGDTWTIPGSSSNEVSDNETIPNYKDSDEFQTGYWRIWPWMEEPVIDFDYVALFKATEHISQMSIRPWNGRGGGNQWDIWTGNGNEQLRDTVHAMIVRYEAPGGSVSSVPLNSIVINTTFEANNLLCRDEFFWGVDNYSIDWYVGINATHFKRSGYICRDGTEIPVLATYNTTLANLNIDSEGGALVGALETKIEDFGPIWIDDAENTINRFAYFRLEFEGNTRAMYEGELIVGDNENFVMSYNYTNYTLRSITSDAYPYGQYFYSCDIPAGFVAISNSSDYLTINNPMESVSLILQKVVSIGLNLSLTREGTPAKNAICTGNISSGVVTTANQNGVCRFTNLPIEIVINVGVTHPGIQRSGLFQIGDYYNSEGYGTGVSCASFQDSPDYLYSWDIERETATFTVKTKSKAAGIDVNDAEVFWDGASVGLTQSGELSFNVEWEFIDHNLTVTHNQFTTGTATVRLGDSPYTIYLVGNATYDADADALGTKTRADFLDMFSSMAFLAIILIVATAGVGFKYAGLPGGAMAASMAAALLALTGMLPWSWAAVIIFLGIVVGLAGGSGGVRSVFTGGK